MKNVTEFINKSIAEIQSNLLFKELFKDSDIKVIENYFYIEDLDNGIDLVLTTENIITSVHLFPNFKSIIPFDLRFDFSKQDIERVLGEPNHSGGGISDFLFGEIPYWMRYVYRDYTIHFQFSKNKKQIDVVTIGSPSNEPYFSQNQN